MAMKQKKIDVAIITALAVERNALVSHLKNCHTEEAHQFSLQYHLGELVVANGIHYNVLIVLTLQPGNVYAATAVKTFLSAWEPSLVVSFGIAGGAGGVGSKEPNKKDQLNYGDVIVAENVFYYEQATETAPSRKRAKSWFHTISCDAKLANFTRLYYENPIESESRPWRTKIKATPPEEINPGCPKVYVGAIASGEKVIRHIDAPSRKAAEEHYSKVRAFEMEAFGVGVSSTKYLIDKYPFLAVKGIADFADQNKGDLWHEYAAHSAAALLFDLLCLLTDKDGRLTHNNRQLTPVSIRDLDNRAELLRNCIPMHFGVVYDRAELQKVLLYPDIDVFYHWRILHKNVHWVDYCFLLFLRQLSLQNYRVNLLVTNKLFSEHSKDVCTQDDLITAKDNTELLIKRIFKSDANIYWYSDLDKDIEEIERYAQNEGLDFVAEDLTDRIRHKMGLKEGTAVTKKWLKFIAWQLQRENNGIVVAWERHAELYRQVLNYFPQISVALIATGDITLGNSYGKFDIPGKNLVINPPTFPEINAWLMNERSTNRLKDFFHYISLSDSDIDNFISKNRKFLQPINLLTMEYGESLVGLNFSKRPIT